MTGLYKGQRNYNTHCVCSELLCEVVIILFSEWLYGLLLHTHGEQGLERWVDFSV